MESARIGKIPCRIPCWQGILGLLAIAGSCDSSAPQRQILSGLLTARPDDLARNLDDDERHESPEQHVGKIMAAEGHAQQARPDPEQEGGDDRWPPPRWRQDARRRDHPEAGRGLSRYKRAVLLAGAVVLVPGAERIRSAEFLGLDGPRTVPVVFQAEIDNEARPDRDRRDEEDDPATARRPA